MSFSSYKSLGDTVKEFQVYYREENFVREIAFPISDYFREDLAFMMREGMVDNSEYAICENLIYPVLKEVWKSYREKFLIWSHQALCYDNNLTGFPEYIIAQRSPLGKVVFDKPYLLLVEAKQDKFDAAWGQCLAEMIAARQLNERSIVIHGIASNGTGWQFGKLEGNTFTKNTNPYYISELDSLFGAINFMFQQCEIQLDTWVAA
ncbi:hypothetical protein V0288_15595 [Pannus brasiliensis CCIBt3594]|uniref:Uncharacterized protein n=1 Tax=Pannus brasiliensis CCIBt3594 TaxID=1427578 RepID=A0AAW9QL78_9CHRO